MNKRAQRGMALIAVLWMVAALTILTTGLVASVRGEIDVAVQRRQLMESRAIGEAAIQMKLQQLHMRPAGLQLRELGTFSFEGVTVQLVAAPLTGWIDINRASPELLAKAFEVLGGVASDGARSLALSVIDQREKKNAQGQARRFEAVEDLMQVPGMEYNLWSKVAPAMAVGTGGDGKVNPLAADETVLRVLVDGQADKLQRFLAARNAGAVGADTSFMNGQFVSATPSAWLRLEARAPLEGGREAVVNADVLMRAGMPDGLSWRVFQTGQFVAASHQQASHQ